MKLNYIQEEGEGVTLSLTVLSIEGIWHLYNLITVGDTLRTRTVRKVSKEGAAAQKKTLTLSILVTSVEFDSNGLLRVAGTNRTECEDVRLGAYHTSMISYDPPQDVKLFKPEWNSLHAERLKMACDHAGRADSAAVTLQAGSAQILLLSGALTTTAAKLDCAIPKKKRGTSTGHDEGIKRFFAQLCDSMILHINPEKVKVVLICGPGTVGEEFLSYANGEARRAEAAPQIKALFGDKSRFVVVKVSNGSKSALREAMSDPTVQVRLQNVRCLGEVAAFGKFQEMMNRDPDRCTYGTQPVFVAAQDSAVDTMLLLDVATRAPEPIQRHFYANLSQLVQEAGGTVHVVSSRSETGEQLHAVGGIAAILRAPMPMLDELVPIENFDQCEIVQEFVRQRMAAAKASGTSPSAAKSFSATSDASDGPADKP